MPQIKLEVYGTSRDVFFSSPNKVVEESGNDFKCLHIHSSRNLSQQTCHKIRFEHFGSF